MCRKVRAAQAPRLRLQGYRSAFPVRTKDCYAFADINGAPSNAAAYRGSYERAP